MILRHFPINLNGVMRMQGCNSGGCRKCGKLENIDFQSTLGKTPRNFAIDPNGNFLLAANQDSSDIFTFKINKESGKLDPTGFKIDIPYPVCIKFLKR